MRRRVAATVPCSAASASVSQALFTKTLVRPGLCWILICWFGPSEASQSFSDGLCVLILLTLLVGLCLDLALCSVVCFQHSSQDARLFARPIRANPFSHHSLQRHYQILSLSSANISAITPSLANIPFSHLFVSCLSATTISHLPR
jgi:hypothetical protein